LTAPRAQLAREEDTMTEAEIAALNARLAVLESLVALLLGERYLDANRAGRNGLALLHADMAHWRQAFAATGDPEVALAGDRLIADVLAHVEARLLRSAG
jgi:transposase